MSLFSGINNSKIKGPDVVINGDGGSLLPTAGSGIRFSSAKINQTSSLLSGIKPYSYGAGSTSDDITYGVNPHKVQKIVPTFTIPSESRDIEGDMITMSHSVDDGDIAFTIRMVHDKNSYIKHWNYFSKQNITRAVDPIINICTVNYILRGLQSNMGENEATWKSFLQCTGWPVDTPTFKLVDFRSGKYQHRNVSMFIQDYIRPLGIVIGSENQGGQHQGGGAVDFPVDFVVTILVDGLCDNMLNIWKRTEIKAGDDLFLALCGTKFKRPTNIIKEEILHELEHLECYTEPDIGLFKYQFNKPGEENDGRIQRDKFVEAKEDTSYVLNHWAPTQRTARFSYPPNLLFELVPTTSSEIREGSFLGDDRRNRGLWHIARSQVHIRGCPLAQSAKQQTFRQDTANLKSGGLVQATIAPVWKSATRSHNVLHGTEHFTWVSHVNEKNKTYRVPHERVESVLPTVDIGCVKQRPDKDENPLSEFNVDKMDTTGVQVSNMIARRDTNNSQPAPAKRTKRSIMEAPVQTTVETYTTPMETDSSMDDPMGLTKVSGKVGTSSKVYARSVNATTSDVTSKPVSVARVSSKKRVEAEISS
jgi:hypothetical protein